MENICLTGYALVGILSVICAVKNKRYNQIFWVIAVCLSAAVISAMEPSSAKDWVIFGCCALVWLFICGSLADGASRDSKSCASYGSIAALACIVSFICGLIFSGGFGLLLQVGIAVVFTMMFFWRMK